MKEYSRNAKIKIQGKGITHSTLNYIFDEITDALFGTLTILLVFLELNFEVATLSGKE